MQASSAKSDLERHKRMFREAADAAKKDAEQAVEKQVTLQLRNGNSRYTVPKPSAQRELE